MTGGRTRYWIPEFELGSEGFPSLVMVSGSKDSFVVSVGSLLRLGLNIALEGCCK